MLFWPEIEHLDYGQNNMGCQCASCMRQTKVYCIKDILKYIDQLRPTNVDGNLTSYSPTTNPSLVEVSLQS